MKYNSCPDLGELLKAQREKKYPVKERLAGVLFKSFYLPNNITSLPSARRDIRDFEKGKLGEPKRFSAYLKALSLCEDTFEIFRRAIEECDPSYNIDELLGHYQDK